MQRIFKQQSSEPKGGELGISGIGGGRNLRWPRFLAATLALVGLLRGPADFALDHLLKPIHREEQDDQDGDN